MPIQPGDALIVVDVQNDFLPGGALGVPGGAAILPAINQAVRLFAERQLPIFFSRDWHPPDHRSFRLRGGPWPVHCVQDTAGSAFASQVALPAQAVIVSKGMNAEEEQYSALFGRDEQGRALEAHLKELAVQRLFLAGLATEYCVLNTVRDALQDGFAVVILSDGVAAVDVNPGDGARALQEMVRLGAGQTSADQLP